MINDDFPVSFKLADEVSLRGQKWHKRLVQVDLILVVAGALLGVASSLLGDYWVGSALVILSAAALAASLGIKAANQKLGFDQLWFDGRAVAESLKSMSWRYVMHVEPFDDESTSKQEFSRRVLAIGKARPDVWRQGATQSSSTSQITDRMGQIRGLPLEERRDFYIRNRLDDQINWYCKKAKANDDASLRWFWASLGAQAIALLVALVRIGVPALGSSMVGAFTTLAAAFIAWAQFARHGELAKSYGLASLELSTIRTLAETVQTREQLAEVVDNSEEAISREHTMWIAKRSEPLPRQLVQKQPPC